MTPPPLFWPRSVQGYLLLQKIKSEAPVGPAEFLHHLPGDSRSENIPWFPKGQCGPVVRTGGPLE